MKPDDKDKLNKCLEILDSTDLGLSLVWLWAWSQVKDNLEGGDWDQLVSEGEAWDLMCKRVESGDGFTLEYGAEQIHDDIVEWMLDSGMIRDWEDSDESDE